MPLEGGNQNLYQKSPKDFGSNFILVKYNNYKTQVGGSSYQIVPKCDPKKMEMAHRKMFISFKVSHGHS